MNNIKTTCAATCGFICLAFSVGFWVRVGWEFSDGLGYALRDKYCETMDTVFNKEEK